MWVALGSCFLFSLAVSVLLVMCGGKIGVFDVPDGILKKHESAVPRTGGIAVAIGLAIGCFVIGYGKSKEALSYLLPFFLLLGVGCVDDKRRLSPFVKLLGEVLAFSAFFALLPVRLSLFSCLLFLLGVFFINAFNFTDGADGIAAGYALPSFLGLSLFFFFYGNVTALVLCLFCAAALLGFLPLNLPRAKLFMGDCGSLGVGFLLSALTVSAMRENAFAVGFILLPTLDALHVVYWRIKEKKRPWIGDRRHLHHLLLERGASSFGLFFLYLSVSILLSAGTVALSLYTK